MSARRSIEGRRVPVTRLRSGTAGTHDGRPSTPRSDLPPTLESTPEQQRQSDRHQRFVLTDSVAFKYLGEDSTTKVLERRKELQGYECFVVEQWATSRTHPTGVITTYTGDPSNVVIVGVLSVPTDESEWSPRLRVYFKALNQYHARRESTPLGTLMVTNLASFPSSLTVIPVPGGDPNKHRADFFVNENLKRLGCSGRVALTLGQPSASTTAKFHQLYHTSDRNDINHSVIELVRLCQSALMLFDKLQGDYADGLLCDVTERAISEWWMDIGRDQYEIDPHDGILGPTTIAGLLGLLMGARNRLHAANAPVTKDAFDLDAMKRGISHFQRQQRIPRTRRLDRRTLDRLHKTTAKAATSEGWSMPRAVKSTVAELSGKGGEMVMDVVGRRDKAGIAEIETTDFERFVQLVYGEWCKWLWYGKSMKHNRPVDSIRYGNGELTFQSDQHGGFTWSRRKSSENGLPPVRQKRSDDLRIPGPDTDGTDEDEQKSGLRKRATDLRNDAKSGFGKIKGAVTLKGNQQKSSKEDSPNTPPRRRELLRSQPTSPLSSPASPTEEAIIEDTLSPRDMSVSPNSRILPTEEIDGSASPRSRPRKNPTLLISHDGVDESSEQEQAPGDQKDSVGTQLGGGPPSIAESIYGGVDLTEALPEGPETEHNVSNLLRRTLSYSQYVSAKSQPHETDYFPRHLSFSLAEDSVLGWEGTEDDGYYSDTTQSRIKLAGELLAAKQTKLLRLAVSDLRSEAAEWTQAQLYDLRGLVDQAEQEQQTLDAMYYPHTDTIQSMSSHTDALVRGEKERLEEGDKELETLAARLNYEIDGLKSRIEDVGNVVDDFTKGVERVEDRVSELERDGERDAGWRCIVS